MRYYAVPQYLKSERRPGWKVVDDTGKFVRGKRYRSEESARKAADVLNRRSEKTTSRNPKQLLFRTRKAAVAFAKKNGARKYSVRKLKRGK